MIETVIDLGEDFAPAETIAEQRVRNDRARWVAMVVAVALLTLLTVTGATVPQPALRAVTRIPAAPESIAMLVGDRVLIGEIRDRSNQLNAYDVRTGARLWSTKLTVLTHGGSIWRVGNVALVTYASGSVSGDMTNAVDIRTGRVLWRSESRVLDVRGGNAIVSASPDLGPLAFSSVDVVTGVIRWSRAVGGACRDDFAWNYVEVCDDGTLSVTDLDTGQIRSRRSLDLGGYQQSGNQYSNQPSLAQSDGLVFIGHYTAGQPRLDAFDATTLAPVWSRSFDPSSFLAPCDGLLCILGQHVQSALDPATGADRPMPGSDSITYGYEDPYAVAKIDIPAAATPYALVPFHLKADRNGIYPGAINLPIVTDSEAVTVPEASRVEGYLATVDPKTGRMSIIDRLDGAGAQSCFALAAYLACEQTGDVLRLWRLPTSAR